MNPAGLDYVYSFNATEDVVVAFEAIVRYLARSAPTSVFDVTTFHPDKEKGLTYLVRGVGGVPFAELREVFIYSDEHTRWMWERYGRVDQLAAGMIHVMVSRLDNKLTLVLDASFSGHGEYWRHVSQEHHKLLDFIKTLPTKHGHRCITEFADGKNIMGDLGG